MKKSSLLTYLTLLPLLTSCSNVELSFDQGINRLNSFHETVTSEGYLLPESYTYVGEFYEGETVYEERTVISLNDYYYYHFVYLNDEVNYTYYSYININDGVEYFYQACLANTLEGEEKNQTKTYSKMAISNRGVYLTLYEEDFNEPLIEASINLVERLLSEGETVHFYSDDNTSLDVYLLSETYYFRNNILSYIKTPESEGQYTYGLAIQEIPHFDYTWVEVAPGEVRAPTFA